MSLNKSLTGKISIGYITIAAISFLAFSICILTLRNNKAIDREISEVSVPNLILFKDMNMMNAELKRLSNVWIYAFNVEDKNKLLDYLHKKYPEARKKIMDKFNLSSSDANKADMKKLVSKFDNIISKVQLITQVAVPGDDSKFEQADKIYKEELLPAIVDADLFLYSSIMNYTKQVNEMQAEKERSYNIFNITLFGVILVIMGTGVISLMISRRIIINPIKELKEAINTLGKGEVPEVKESNVKDEIGEMRNSVRSMINGFKANMDFAIEIGKGNYEVNFVPLSDKDQMGNALLEMRKNLKTNAEEDGKRNWATLGLAKIGEVLRRTDVSSEKLYDDVVSYLVKYMDANQAGLFIVEKENDKDIFLDLKACYAYERKKFVEKRILAGSGLVGQCYLEGESIIMTEIPRSYVEITSGLGSATPSAIVIVPLKINKVIYGILEMASFKEFEKYQLDFLEKIGESIASMISNVKISEETTKLLQDSQMNSEMLRAQEEEMRQNMEELTATQEEMYRKENEYIKKLEELNRELDILKNEK